jgi:NitT/TauT family transport system substrate-binding protein
MKGKGKDIPFICLSVLALLLTLTSSALTAEKVKLGTALRTHPVFYLPVVSAEEKGFWKQQSIDVEWVPFRGGAAMTKGLAAGAAHMGIDGVTGAVVAITRGVPTILVSHLGVRDLFGIWVPTDSPVRQPRDLRGKKIDVTRLGGSSHAYAKAVTRALGIEREVKFMASGGIREQVAALKAGAIDSAMLTFFAIARIWASGEAREVLKVEDYLPKPWVNRVINSRKDFLASNPQSVGKVVKAILASTDFVMKDKAWTMAKMQSVSGYSPKVAEAVYPILKFSPDGQLDKKGLNNVRQFLIDLGVIKAEKAPPVEKLYTTQFTS